MRHRHKNRSQEISARRFSIQMKTVSALSSVYLSQTAKLFRIWSLKQRRFVCVKRPEGPLLVRNDVWTHLIKRYLFLSVRNKGSHCI